MPEHSRFGQRSANHAPIRVTQPQRFKRMLFVAIDPMSVVEKGTDLTMS